MTTLYNERCQPTELLFQDEWGKLLSRVVLRYDVTGNLVEETQTRPIETLPPEAFAGLDEEQRETVIKLLGLGEPVSQLHQYDEECRRIETYSQEGCLGGNRSRWLITTMATRGWRFPNTSRGITR